MRLPRRSQPSVDATHPDRVPPVTAASIVGLVAAVHKGCSCVALRGPGKMACCAGQRCQSLNSHSLHIIAAPICMSWTVYSAAASVCTWVIWVFLRGMSCSSWVIVNTAFALWVEQMLRLVSGMAAMYRVTWHAASVVTDRCALHSLFADILVSCSGVIMAQPAHSDGTRRG